MRVKHFVRQKYWKKVRRSKKRILRARLRDEQATECDCEATGVSGDDGDEQAKREELEWLEREKRAQELWKERHSRLSMDENAAECSHDTGDDRGDQQKDCLILESVPPRLPFDLPYRNPFEPAEFRSTTEDTRQICQFYRKTGVCRFDTKCSRSHTAPIVSDTIVFLNMFHSAAIDTELRLECDDTDLSVEYDEFYRDIEQEFASFGRLVTIRTCRNALRHLRGNVYVQYRHINDAVYAFSQLNGRFYGGNALVARFVSIDNWRESICGLFFRQRCPKGEICNFLHVLLNSGESERDLYRFLSDSANGNSRRRRYRRSDRSKTCSVTSCDELSTPDNHNNDDSNTDDNCNHNNSNRRKSGNKNHNRHGRDRADTDKSHRNSPCTSRYRTRSHSSESRSHRRRRHHHRSHSKSPDRRHRKKRYKRDR